MRLRNITGCREMIQDSRYVVDEDRLPSCPGTWHERFGNNNPIRIEVGMGKGRFITELAAAHPEINYIGIERYTSVLLKAVEKRSLLFLPNLYFLCVDARTLPDIFAEGEVDRIYLNFSDPWPKDRHAKRRLTSPQFMALYDRILAPEGQVEFKTDNMGLFDYSLESIPEAGWTITASTKDLHHSDMAEGNIMTEYEAKFSAMGNPICKLIAVRHGESNR